MTTRFNRHRPALCADCGKPLSVRERRVAEGVMVCAWDAYQRYRKEFESEMGGWVGEPAYPSPEVATPQIEIHEIDFHDLFG